jgi:hypothetical protein
MVIDTIHTKNNTTAAISIPLYLLLMTVLLLEAISIAIA